MAFYFLVEGRKTEMQIYPFWINELIPKYKRVSRIQEITQSDHYCIQSGFGHPHLKQYIVTAKNIIEKYGVSISHFIIVVDSDDNPTEFRKLQYEKYIQENFNNPKYKIEIIVQPISIESWLLGNKKLFTTRKKNDSYLKDYLNFYNVKLSDPELLPPLSNKIRAYANTKADFYYLYLKKLVNVRADGKYTYKKENPQFVCNKSFLNGIISRAHEGHLKNFSSTIELLKSL